MSNIHEIGIPGAPGSPPGPSGGPPLQVVFSEDEANYLLHVIGFFGPLLKEFTNRFSPGDLVAVLGFLQAALETQVPGLRGAFDDVREFFDNVYPLLLKADAKENGEVTEPQSLMLVFPQPAPGTPAVSPLEEEPRIIIAGNDRVN